MVRSPKQIIGYSVLIGALALPSFIVPQPTLVANAEFSVPAYPSCVSFSGTIQAQHLNSNHAIVGRSDQVFGNDTVYDLGNANYLQCYCPLESAGTAGIQTDWLNAASLDEATISQLMDQGWYYIGQGQDWGLDSIPFLAKNSDFSCASAEPTATPVPSPDQVPTPTPVPSADNTPTPTVVPAVGGASADSTPTPTPTPTSTPSQTVIVPTEVKKLAGTGTFVQTFMSSLFAAGVMFASSAGVLYGKSKKA